MITLLPDDPQAAADVVALRNALARTIAERDTWRRNYLELAARVERLTGRLVEVAQLRAQA